MSNEHFLLDDERMTPDQLIMAMRNHGFGDEESMYKVDVKGLAAVFKVSVQAVYLWIRGINPIPHYVKLYFAMLADKESVRARPQLGSNDAVVQQHR